jgi:hypothetical protein
VPGIGDEVRRSIAPRFALYLAVATGLAIAGHAFGESPSRQSLDALWEQHMFEGRLSMVSIELRHSKMDAVELAPSQSFESARGSPEDAASTSYGITVMRLGDGLWGNGGWVIKGGLLDRAGRGSSTVDLYGKAAVRRLPYFPFPFHREIPHETDYEFFLLRRQPADPRTIIVRKWVFPSDEVMVKRESTGGTYENVRGRFTYDTGTATATVTIAGLKRPFAERVDLSPQSSR